MYCSFTLDLALFVGLASSKCTHIYNWDRKAVLNDTNAVDPVLSLIVIVLHVSINSCALTSWAGWNYICVATRGKGTV